MLNHPKKMDTDRLPQASLQKTICREGKTRHLWHQKWLQPNLWKGGELQVISFTQKITEIWVPQYRILWGFYFMGKKQTGITMGMRVPKLNIKLKNIKYRFPLSITCFCKFHLAPKLLSVLKLKSHPAKQMKGENEWTCITVMISIHNSKFS